MWYVYIYTVEYYSAIKKKEILALTTAWMDLKGIMLSDISQIEKDKYCIISLMWNLKQTNTVTGTENRLVAASSRGGGEMGEGDQKVHILQL